MAKSKTKRGDKEFDTLDRMKYENNKLKKEVTSLRKQIESLRKMVTSSDIGRYEEFEEFIKEKRQDRKIAKSKETTQKQKRQCWDCGKGVLVLKTMSRRDGLMYWRACDNEMCGKTTLMKPHNSSVED